MSWLQHPYAVTVARWIVAVLFIITATGKLRERRRFLQTVLSYQVLPARFAYPYAVVVPWLEGAVGILLLSGLLSKIAATISAVLLISFIIAIGINLVRGRSDLECGCFGARRHQKINITIILRNLIFLGLSIQVILFSSGYFALDGLIFKERTSRALQPPIEGLLQIAAIGVGAILLYLLVQQFITLRAYPKTPAARQVIQAQAK